MFALVALCTAEEQKAAQEEAPKTPAAPQLAWVPTWNGWQLVQTNVAPAPAPPAKQQAPSATVTTPVVTSPVVTTAWPWTHSYYWGGWPYTASYVAPTTAAYVAAPTVAHSLYGYTVNTPYTAAHYVQLLKKKK